jgi:hypothetical protein
MTYIVCEKTGKFIKYPAYRVQCFSNKYSSLTSKFHFNQHLIICISLHRIGIMLFRGLEYWVGVQRSNFFDYVYQRPKIQKYNATLLFWPFLHRKVPQIAKNSHRDIGTGKIV